MSAQINPHNFNKTCFRMAAIWRYVLCVSALSYSATAFCLAPIEATGAAFAQTYAWDDIQIEVTSPNTATNNRLHIVPTGLQTDNSAIETPITGQVIGAEVGDLNVDGSPEIYIYVRDNDPKKRMTLVAYSANKKKSLSMINLPALSKARLREYCGGDEMAVVENTFVRRYPICKQGKATQQTRQIQYKLKPGEAMWQLKVNRVLKY
jgi:hypothetical protein